MVRGEKGYMVQNMGIQKDPEITHASGLVRAEVTSFRSCWYSYSIALYGAKELRDTTPAA